MFLFSILLIYFNFYSFPPYTLYGVIVLFLLTQFESEVCPFSIFLKFMKSIHFSLSIVFHVFHGILQVLVSRAFIDIHF